MMENLCKQLLEINAIVPTELYQTMKYRCKYDGVEIVDTSQDKNGYIVFELKIDLNNEEHCEVYCSSNYYLAFVLSEQLAYFNLFREYTLNQ
jgi:hypothetical protein